MRRLPLILCFALAACSQVRVNTPNPRVETPEVRGDQFKWKFGVAGGDSHHFYATHEGGARPPDLTKPQARGNLDVYPGLAFQPWAPVEMGVEANLLGTGLNALVKYQFVGEGTRHAEEDDFAAAVYMRSGFVQNNNSGDQESTFGAGGYKWSSKTENSFVHAGVSVGQHVSKVALVYAGVAAGNYWARARIDQDASGTDPGGSYHASFKGWGVTEALGAQFSWRVVQFYVSAEYTKVDYGPADDLEALFLNTGVTFTPGASRE
jgi:hypothetical protein